MFLTKDPLDTEPHPCIPDNLGRFQRHDVHPNFPQPADLGAKARTCTAFSLEIAMERIHVLQPTVAARVRSGYVIQTIAQAVEECFSNSIDAGATEVQIVIDERLFNFEIEDNGHGIPADSFGSLGVRFATSKLRNLNQLLAGPSTYGFRGEALASLAECSVLQISSKARGQFQTWTKVISGGVTLQVGLSTNQRKIHGTVVSVKDFQYNQPVRRKQSQLSRCGPDTLDPVPLRLQLRTLTGVVV